MMTPNHTGMGAVDRLDGWIKKREHLFFAALVVAHLVPIWAFAYFPSLDGPAHLSITDILVRYNDPALPAFREFYEINRHLDPNLFIFIVLYPLMQIAPALIAEKLLLSAYVILVPLSLQYALRAVSAHAISISLVGFLLIYHFPLHMGFYNFSFGMVFFLFSFGFWLRRRDDFRLKVFLGYFLLFFLNYISHLFSLAITCAAIALATIGGFLLETRRQSRERAPDAARLLRPLLGRALLPALASLPWVLAAFAFFARIRLRVGEGTAQDVDWFDITRLQELMTATSLVSHAPLEVLVAKAFALTILGLAGLVIARKIPGAARVDPLFFVVVGFVCLYLITPYQVSSRWMPDRIMLYVFAAALLWLGAQADTAISRRAVLVRPFVIATVVAISLAGIGIRWVKYAEFNDHIREYLSASEYLDPNATLLSLRISPFADGEKTSERIDLYLQTAGYIALERSIIDIRNTQAAAGGFPVRYRASVNPQVHLARDDEITLVPPDVDLFRYKARTGKDIDYVLLWGKDDYLKDDIRGRQLRAELVRVGRLHVNEYPYAVARYRRLVAQLASAYDLVFTSSERGLARLYRRRGLGGATGSEIRK